MTSRPNALPLRFVDPGARNRLPDSLFRAIVAVGRNAGSGNNAEALARQLWPDDRAAQMLIRASVSPASTVNAEVLAPIAAALLTSLGPTSAASELMRRVPMLDFDGVAVFVPTMVVATGNTAFVGQGEPIPIRTMAFDGATLVRHKLATGFALTSEVFLHSSAEAVVRQTATECIAVDVDEAMFGTDIGTDARPPGLRYAVAATAATAGGTNEAMIADLSALAAVVAPVGGLNIAFVAAPGEAVKIALRAPQFRFPVFATGALPTGTVMVIAIPALAVAVDPLPRFEISKESVIHAEDTTPLAISTEGAPATVAAPSRSLWQTDCVGVRLIMQVAWGLRVAGAVAWTENVTW